MSIYEGKDLAEPLKIDSLKLLVTGCSRSGTVYSAKLLTSVGFPCGHESIFTPGGLEEARNRLSLGEVCMSDISKQASVIDEAEGREWFGDNRTLVAESSYMAAPFVKDELLLPVKIIHLVREPLKVINSVVYGFHYFEEQEEPQDYETFIYNHVPELRDLDDPVSRAALFYVRWNEMVEQRKGAKYFFHRLEDSPRPLFCWLGVNPESYFTARTNRCVFERKIFSTSQIPDSTCRRALEEIAERYNYPLSHPLF